MIRITSFLFVCSCLIATTAFSQDDAQVAKHRKASAANLRQMMIGMHNYHNDYIKMPNHATYDKAGKNALLSWRVTILPYVNQDRLYKKFKLDQPWDSSHNKALLNEMPDIYKVPGVQGAAGKTYYQVFTMPAGGDPTQKKFVPMFTLSPTARLTLGQLTVQDGTSNTIGIVEASTAVEWTKPEDIVLADDNAPIPQLGIRPNSDTFAAVFGDGSVYNIKIKIDDEAKHTRLMRQLIGRKDGMNEDVDSIVKRQK